MRLDLFLKASRLSPRRSTAQQLCDAGLVTVNGGTAKSAHPVRMGDEILIRRRDRLTKVRVLSVPKTHNVARKDASSLYELLTNGIEAAQTGLK